MSLDAAMNPDTPDEQTETVEPTAPVETKDETAPVTPPVTGPEEEEVQEEVSEIELLRKRADLLGIRYRSNTGADKLRSMIAAKLAEEEPTVASASVNEEGETVVQPKSKVQQVREARQKALELIRIRITCQNPLKTEWESEIFTFGNSLVGTIKRAVPYETEWHVERALYEMIKARKYQHFFNVKDKETGRTVRSSKLVPEFAIEVLPPLTPKELKELAQRQAMAEGTQD